MDAEYKRRSRAVPSFGRWDNYMDDFCLSECFETARQAGGSGGLPAAVPYNNTNRFVIPAQDRDLYVSGDLYHNDVVTPAMIVVPRRTKVKARYPHAKEEKKEGEWVVCDYDVKRKVTTPAVPISPKTKPPKAVDEDLYKISPDQLLYAKTKKKRGFDLFSCCRIPL